MIVKAEFKYPPVYPVITYYGYPVEIDLRKLEISQCIFYKVLTQTQIAIYVLKELTIILKHYVRDISYDDLKKAWITNIDKEQRVKDCIDYISELILLSKAPLLRTKKKRKKSRGYSYAQQTRLVKRA